MNFCSSNYYQMSQIYFSVIDIFPVGFVIEPENPPRDSENRHCLICRGKLNMPCCECQDNKESDCKYLDNQMHNHCFVTANTVGEWK